jgi:hypothetical protein
VNKANKTKTSSFPRTIAKASVSLADQLKEEKSNGSPNTISFKGPVVLKALMAPTKALSKVKPVADKINVTPAKEMKKA